MNTILKVSVAGALALGYVSAHASIAQVSSYSAGDVLLFAEVLNSSGAVIGSYAGDTGVAITNITSGSYASGTSTATALVSFTGTGIDLIGTRGAYGGIAEVSVDGAAPTDADQVLRW